MAVANPMSDKLKMFVIGKSVSPCYFKKESNTYLTDIEIKKINQEIKKKETKEKKTFSESLLQIFSIAKTFHSYQQRSSSFFDFRRNENS